MNARLLLASLCVIACNAASGDTRPGSGPNGLCGCEFTAGESCCVPSGGGPASCTTDGTACTTQGGIAIGCVGYVQTTDSACCWNGAAKAGNFTRYASTCGNGPTSCITDEDCNGGKCTIQKCGTVAISACDVTPACP